MATTTSLIMLLLLFSTCHFYKDHEIGERSVLLPIDYGATHRVQHLMEAFGGCYIWTTSEPSVLKVSPLDNDHECKSRALIEVQREGAYSGSLSVLATDRQTKQVMKAIVKLSKLHRIEILTKFRIMNLFQVQEFYLIGYDELGNSFSSLQGLKFEWIIQQSGRVAERITIRESNIFQETNYRRSLEELGYQTDMLVIKTLNIGQIELVVRLNEPNYEHISTSIRLSVQERFDIVPVSPLYMLTGSRVRLNLLNAKEQKIKLPASYYDFSIGSDFKVSDDLVITSPTFETETRLVVKDTRTKPPYTNEVSIFNLHPDSIEVSAKSYIIVGDNQPFKVSLFNNRRLLKGSVSIKLDSDFYLDKQNSSFVANGKGAGYIRATYNGLTHEKRIMANLKLKPVLVGSKIVLPPGQTFELKILGGSGSYEYSLIDFGVDVATINQNGVIHSNKIGKAQVVVIDSNDNNNKVEIELVVDGVKSIRSFDERLEAGVGQEVTMLAIAQPEHERQFTQCDDLLIGVGQNELIQYKSGKENTIQTILKIHQNARENLELRNVLSIFRQGRDFDLSDYRDYVFENEISLDHLQRLLWIQDNFGICKALRVEPLVAREGEAQFLIKGGENYASTPFKVKIYNELGIKDQTSNRILLTPGSYFIWKAHQNGADGTTYFLNNIKIRDGDPISLTCTLPGEVKQYNIKVVHQISQKLPRPYTREIKIIIECLHPSSLKYKAGDYVVESSHLYTVDGSPFKLQLKGFDHLGRQFYNISSLDFTWNLDGVSKSEVSPQDNIYRFSFTKDNTNPHINTKTSGSRYNGISFPEIEANLDIIRSKPFILMFKNRQVLNSLTLVATPNHKQILNIIGGSKNFEIKSSNPDLLRTNFHSNERKIIELLPLKRGNVKLYVTDLEQFGRPATEIDVKIVNPVKLRIKSNASLVEQGSGFKLEYFVYGQDDVLIDEAQYEYLNIFPKYNCELEELDSRTFRALKRGLCSITASMAFHSISSQNSIEIQVFPKFSINIPNIVEQQKNGVKYYTGETRVPVDCVSTIMFLGGPFGAGKLTYQSYPSNVVDITQLNLRTFRLSPRKKGTTELKFVLRDGDKEISVIKITVIVKDIESVGLNYGNRQIHQKAQIRLIPQIQIDGQRVLSSKCPIKYQWRTDNQDVLDIRGWNHHESMDNAGINVTGLKKGFGKIQFTPIYNARKLPKQEIIIQVLETTKVDLATYIHHGKVDPTSLLIPPNSGYSINSTYVVEIVSPCENLMKISGNNIETFNDKGGSVVRLKTPGRQNSVTYMSIQVERIHSLFIENPVNKINLQLDTQIRVPFYVQDSFGRLFPNNLKGVEFSVRVSNPQIVSAEISADKQEIILRGYNSGDADLQISITGHPDIYDVVPVETMVLLTPVSPVLVHVGGNIQFRSVKAGSGDWKSEAQSIVQIDRKTGKALALKEGETQVSFDYGIEYKSRVQVYRVHDIDILEVNDLMTNYKSDEQKIQLRALMQTERGVVELKQFSRQQSSIDNNLIVRCSSIDPLWFDVTCSIQNEGNDQFIAAYVRATKNYPANQDMPKQLQFQIWLQSGNTGQTIVHKTLSHPFVFEFKIPKSDQSIALSPNQRKRTIEIKTNYKLGVVSNSEKSSWLETQFVPERSLQLISIDAQHRPDSSKSIITVWNYQTKQTEKIAVSYGAPVFSSRGEYLANNRWSATTWILIVMVVLLILFFALAFLKKDFVYYGKDD